IRDLIVTGVQTCALPISAAITFGLRARAQTAEKKLGVAIVGLGNYAGGQIAPALQLTQHCRLMGVVTGSPAKGQQWARQFGFPEIGRASCRERVGIWGGE